MCVLNISSLFHFLFIDISILVEGYLQLYTVAVSVISHSSFVFLYQFWLFLICVICDFLFFFGYLFVSCPFIELYSASLIVPD